MSDEESLTHHLSRIEALVQVLEQIGSSEASEAARELVRTLLELHRVTLSRMLGQVGQDEMAKHLLAAWTRDRLVAGVLLLHGLHPVDLETRVRQALDSIQPQLRSHGAAVELLGIVDGVIRLQLHEEGTSPGRVLRTILEQILGEAAPDAEFIHWEGMEEPETTRMSLPLISRGTLA